MDNIDKIIQLKIEENIKKAFFDNIALDISENSFESSFNILSEIKERLCNIVPKRRDIHRELDENLDVDFYRQIQSNNALDQNTINGIMFYIIEQIKTFGSLEDELWNEIWKTQIQVKINRGDPLNRLLSDFFKEAMHRIDKIEQEIFAFKQSDLYKYISEKKNKSN